MQTRILPIKAVLIASASVALLTCSARAQISLTNQFSGPGTAIFDLRWMTNQSSLSFDIPKGFHSTVTNTLLTGEVNLALNGTGKLSGGAATPLWLVENQTDTNSFTGTCRERGATSSSKGVVRTTLSLQASGEALFDNVIRHVSGSGTSSLTFNANSGQLSGRFSERISVSGLGSIVNTSTLGPYPLAQYGDGSWTLILNLTNGVGNKAVGSATVTLQTGWVLPFSITGSYGPRPTLHLKGDGAALGSFLNVTLTDSQISRMTGRVLGQSVLVVLALPSPSTPPGDGGVVFIGL